VIVSTHPRLRLAMALALLGAALGSAPACSAGPAPVSQSLRDPSNPAAPEGVAPVVPLRDAGTWGRP
jgi:hypothetical protein